MDANKAVGAVDANVDLFQPMVGRSVSQAQAVGYLVPPPSALPPPPGGREPDTAETNSPLSGEDLRGRALAAVAAAD